MKYAVKMTGPVQQVLQAMLEDPAVPRYGLEISKRAGLETGTLYPVMARLEGVGWVESSWEDRSRQPGCPVTGPSSRWISSVPLVGPIR